MLVRNPLASEWLELELTNGNDGRGGRWFSSAKVRKEIEQYLRVNELDRQPFDVKTKIVLTRVLGPRQKFWDSDSLLRGNSKEIIDALVAVGWFYDDGPAWVTETRCLQDASRRQLGPAIVVEVFDATTL